MEEKKPEEQEKEHPVAKALRQELLTLMQQPLTPKLLQRISRLAMAAHSTLDALLAAGSQRRRVGSVLYNPSFVEGYEDGEEGSVNYNGIATNGETYGATLARELVSAATQFMQAQNAKPDDPVKVVQAISAARAAGLDDVEKGLRARLGILDAVPFVTALPTVAVPVADGHCPTCDSPEPHRHPAIQEEGEVQPCKDPFHWKSTPANTPAKIAALDETVAKLEAAS